MKASFENIYMKITLSILSRTHIHILPTYTYLYVSIIFKRGHELKKKRKGVHWSAWSEEREVRNGIIIISKETI